MAEGVREDRRVGRAAHGVAAGRQRAERVAVVALPPGDEARALRLADLDEVLPRQLQRRLVPLRAGGAEPGVGQPARRVAHQRVGQPLRALAGEQAGMRVGELVELRLDRGDDARVPMAEAGHRGAARAVDDRAPRLVVEVDALAAERQRRVGPQAAVDDARHAERNLRVRGCHAGRCTASGVQSCKSHSMRAAAARSRRWRRRRHGRRPRAPAAARAAAPPPRGSPLGDG